MKIVYTCPYSEIAAGGDSRVAWELARYMAGNTANEVWMLCPDTTYSIKKDHIEPELMVRTLKSTDVKDGLRIYSPTVNKINKIYKVLNELSPDVVHGHTIDPLSFIIQGWCSNHGIPYVYTGHLLATKFNDWQPLDLNFALKPIVNVSLDVYTTTYYQNCTKIVCLNEYARKDFEEFTKDPSKLVVIPNGHVFDEVERSVNIQKDNPIRLMFSGYICERKNQLLLIKMLKYLDTKREVELLLPGKFHTSDYEDIVNEEISSLPENRKVVLPGYIDHEELLKLYSKTHIFVSAALAEVQSLSVIESLAFGTPVVGLSNTTTTELIKDNYNGTVLDADSTTPQDFAKSVSKYLNMSQSKYLNVCKNCKESVKFLEYSNVSKQFVNLYSELIEKSKHIEKKDRGLNYLKRFLRFRDSNEKKKINYRYGIFLGVVSVAVVAGLGAMSIGKSINKIRKKKE